MFDTDVGLSFYRTDMVNRSKVAVRNDKYNCNLRIYRFNNIPADTFQSPYISWENLNCCGGWRFNKDYLLTAVLSNKKLCAGIVFDDEDFYNRYIDAYCDNHYYFSHSVQHCGESYWRSLDIARKGSISDYINILDVKITYDLLGIDFLDWNDIQKYLDSDIMKLIDGSMNYNYANPQNDTQLVVGGLLLGYPIESTAAILTE